MRFLTSSRVLPVAMLNGAHILGLALWEQVSSTRTFEVVDLNRLEMGDLLKQCFKQTLLSHASLSWRREVPRKDFSYLLDDTSRMVVYFSHEKGVVIRFVVKLEHKWGGVWYELIRYDCYHGFVHKDVLKRSGVKKRVVKYRFLDPASGLNAALADCAENFRSYIARWHNG
jgi:hypothetical protein